MEFQVRESDDDENLEFPNGTLMTIEKKMGKMHENVEDECRMNTIYALFRMTEFGTEMCLNGSQRTVRTTLLNALYLFCEPKFFSPSPLPAETCEYFTERLLSFLLPSPRCWMVAIHRISAWPRIFKTILKCCQCHISVSHIKYGSSHYSNA